MASGQWWHVIAKKKLSHPLNDDQMPIRDFSGLYFSGFLFRWKFFKIWMVDISSQNLIHHWYWDPIQRKTFLISFWLRTYIYEGRVLGLVLNWVKEFSYESNFVEGNWIIQEDFYCCLISNEKTPVSEILACCK